MLIPLSALLRICPHLNNGKSETTPEQDWLNGTEDLRSEPSVRADGLPIGLLDGADRATQLSDKVIHVVSGLQVAGFPHVVCCLWPSIDGVCVEVASGFYSALFQQGESLWEKERRRLH